MESILTSIKKLLGITEEYTHFDNDLIMHINTVFMTLQQLGVGPEEGFFIENDSETWSDYLSDPMQLHMVKTYMHHKVRLLFDPPANGTLIECMDKSIAEMEWRLNVAVESAE